MYSKSELMDRLDTAMRDRNNDDDIPTAGAKQWFIGEWSDDAFKVFLKLKRPNNFVPVISGVITPKENGGSMAVVKYQLFPSSRNFLTFWTIITILITLFFAIPYQAYLYAMISFGACLVNYIITYENFKIQVRKSRRALMTVFE